MSKLELQKRTYEISGISYEESQFVLKLEPSMYKRIGEMNGFELLSTLFYNHVFNDTDQAFRSIFASSTKNEAIDNQYKFFVQTFGGPDLYQQKKGSKYTRLVGRHANYNITHKAADRWIYHMKNAMQEHPQLQNDDSEAKELLMKYFQYTAHYIVVASEYMRPDQLSGGTQLDPERIW